MMTSGIRLGRPARTTAWVCASGDMPVRDMPVRDMPVGDMPVRDMPVPDMPVPDMPVRDMPVRDMPVGDTIACVLDALAETGGAGNLTIEIELKAQVEVLCSRVSIYNELIGT